MAASVCEPHLWLYVTPICLFLIGLAINMVINSYIARGGKSALGETMADSMPSSAFEFSSSGGDDDFGGDGGDSGGGGASGSW